MAPNKASTSANNNLLGLHKIRRLDTQNARPVKGGNHTLEGLDAIGQVFEKRFKFQPLDLLKELYLGTKLSV